MDISPGQIPKEVHPNFVFFADDFEDTVSLGDKFEYIHLRLPHGIRNLTQLTEKICEALEPGGWVEIKEFEFPLHFEDPDIAVYSDLWAWSEQVVAGAASIGIDLTSVTKVPEVFEAAGLEIGGTSVTALPIGTWPEDPEERALASRLLGYFMETMEAFVLRASLRLECPTWRTWIMLAKVRQEILEYPVRASLRVRTIWARKPELPAEASSSL
jgi:hypothetical protein